ncbi:MAG: hypothetical protein R2717_03375 [Schumannella sp.]
MSRVGVVACLLLVGGVSGCSAPESPIELPEQDVDRWVMPLDRFMDSNDIAANYAETLLMGPCMAAAGFAWDVPWRDTDAAYRETSSPVGIRIFNTRIAQEYGYRSSPVLDPGAAAWTAWAYREIGDDEVAAMSRCREEVRATELPDLPGEAQFANELAFQAYDAAEQDGGVQDAGRQWHDCMEDVGIPDLPATPRDMPSIWLIETLDLSDPNGIPSAEEIRYATADAECRDSSGYITTFYETLWDKEAELVRSNADALLRIEAVVTEHREKVAEIISTHAPPAPE